MRPKIFGSSFADVDPTFLRAQRRLEQCYASISVDKSFSFSKADIINTPFYQQNRWILDQKRGCGYWLWKPYLIAKLLRETCSDPDDIVWYNDSRSVISGEQAHYIREVVGKHGLYLRFDPCWKRSQYTKRDAFVFMGLDSEQYWNGFDIHAATLAFSRRRLAVVEEWLHYSRFPNVISDLPNVSGKSNLPDFVDHRHDQAVLSLLANKYNLPLQKYEDCKAYAGDYLTQVPIS